jgi:hypothetical protein
VNRLNQTQPATCSISGVLLCISLCFFSIWVLKYLFVCDMILQQNTYFNKWSVALCSWSNHCKYQFSFLYLQKCLCNQSKVKRFLKYIWGNNKYLNIFGENLRPLFNSIFQFYFVYEQDWKWVYHTKKETYLRTIRN